MYQRVLLITVTATGRVACSGAWCDYGGILVPVFFMQAEDWRSFLWMAHRLPMLLNAARWFVSAREVEGSMTLADLEVDPGKVV